MEEALKAAALAVKLAKGALRKGLVELALLRYGIAIGTLQGLLLASQTMEEDMTEEEDQVLIKLLDQLEREAQMIISDWGNGHRNPPRHEIAGVGEAMLAEIYKIREWLS